MRFRAFTWRFRAPSSQVALRWPRCDILGGGVCTCRRQAGQLRRAWLIAVNHAFRRRRAHEISLFKVAFHVFVQLLGIYSAPTPIQIHGWEKWLWDRISVGYLCGLESGVAQRLKHFGASWEHHSSEINKYNLAFEWFSGAYSYTKTHMMVVVVRQNMCAVSVWTWIRHSSVIQALWRKLRA